MSDNIITKKKYEELSAELTLIKEVSLPAVLIKIKEAREQ
jgi:transcription elongation GreA/GreB family factor